MIKAAPYLAKTLIAWLLATILPWCTQSSSIISNSQQSQIGSSKKVFKQILYLSMPFQYKPMHLEG